MSFNDGDNNKNNNNNKLDLYSAKYRVCFRECFLEPVKKKIFDM